MQLVAHANDTNTGLDLERRLNLHKKEGEVTASWLPTGDASGPGAGGGGRPPGRGGGGARPRPQYQSAAANKAREDASAAQRAESELETELSSLQEQESTDFGPDGVFYKLKGQCFDHRVNNQYTYTACPFGTAKQDSTSLG